MLIVEDDWLLANDLASAVTRAGGEVIGPVGQMGAALEILTRRRPDLAIVDGRLRGVTTEPLVLALSLALVPTIIAAGEPGGRDLPRVCISEKPVEMSLLVLMARSARTDDASMSGADPA